MTAATAYKFHTAGYDTKSNEPAVLMDIANVRCVLPEGRLSEELDGAFASGNKQAIAAFTEAFTILHQKMALQTPLTPISGPYAPAVAQDRVPLGRTTAFDPPSQQPALQP